MANIIAIIGMIIQVLRYLPDIVRLIKEIMDLLRSLKGTPGLNEKALLAEFREALKSAKETKDASKLEAFHKKLASLCAGDECPVGLQHLRDEEAGADKASSI